MCGCWSWAVIRISRRKRSAPDGGGDLRIEHLDRDLPLVAAVAREEDERHAPATDLPLDDVAVAEDLLDLVEEIAHAGGDYLVSTPVARGPRRERSSPVSTGAGTLFRSRTRYSSTALPAASRWVAGELPLLDLGGEDRFDLRPRALGVGALDPDQGVQRLRRLGRIRRPVPFADPPPGSGGQRLKLLRRHRLQDVAIELGDEGPGAVGQRERALQPPRSARALEMGGGAAEIGVPEDQHEHVEEERHHRRGRHHLHSGREPDADREEDVDRVLGVAQRVAETDRRDDPAEAERERDAVLHQQHDAGDHDRQDDERLHHRLAEPLLLPGEDVHPAHRQHEEEGARSCRARW